MARRHGGGRRRGGAAKHEDGNERWLLTYADMITLLMALFMVLFSISSVNISKWVTLQRALHAAFSGNILPGGKAIAKPGSANTSHPPSSLDVQAVVPVTSSTASTLQSSSTHGATSSAATATATAQSVSERQAALFSQIKHELDEYARSHGFAKKVETSIEPRGLVIRVLTDDLLFASGQAALSSRSTSLLEEISQLLNLAGEHPVNVEGNTDDVPIHSAIYPSNWELSTARASTVVRFLSEHGVSAGRLTATGYADQHPIASDATARGRARNRRVEIVLQRVDTGQEP
jgi:chemotaxis protein MotB